MSTITTMNQLLGSLVGAYIGHYYLHSQSAWPNVSNTPLYQSWLHSAQLLKPAVPQSAASLIIPLPWLLHHHDNSRLRHQQLAQYLGSTSLSPTDHLIEFTSALYVLGDILEWLMQCPLDLRELLPQLWEALQKKLTEYPAAVIPWISHLINGFNAKPSVNNNHSAGPMATIVLAVQQGLSYRENLALAFANQQMPQATLPIMGCLLGAWGGISIIPMQWMLSFSSDSRQALAQLAQQLYQNWAGISGTADNIDVWPLDF